jgi:hypothetical protein
VTDWQQLPSDSALTLINRVSLLGSYREFLWAPLPSSTFSLLTGQWLDFHQLADYHASRTAIAKLTDKLYGAPSQKAIKGELDLSRVPLTQLSMETEKRNMQQTIKRKSVSFDCGFSLRI